MFWYATLFFGDQNLHQFLGHTIVIDFILKIFVLVSSPARSTPLFHTGLNSGWFRPVPVISVDFGEFWPVYQFQLVLKSNPINPSCHNAGHLKKRIPSQQSSFSSSLVFLCVSSPATLLSNSCSGYFLPSSTFYCD